MGSVKEMGIGDRPGHDMWDIRPGHRNMLGLRTGGRTEDIDREETWRDITTPFDVSLPQAFSLLPVLLQYLVYL